jgi:deoxycytidine triphosphate deaminase
MPIELLDIDPAISDEEAAARAIKFKQVDPFPDVKPALLSAADIEDYSRVTAMLFPFHAEPDTLKPASYEARPGRKFVRWDNAGNRIEMNIQKDDNFELPPNSISFIQIEPKIRLPDYIAIRFNLRITHVHRGLLLGTGPLIDPGFSGVPLIPLHNLTSESYRIRGGEGLIWIEFTKTAPAIVRPADPSYLRRGVFHALEPYKTDREINYYFQRANEGRAIRSSIPQAIENAASSAKAAATSAENAAASAVRISQIYTGIGTGAALAIVITLIIGLHQYFGQIQGNVETTQTLAGNIATVADQAKRDASRALDDAAALRRDLATATAQIDDLRNQLGAVSRELSALRPSAPASIPPPRR